MTDNQDVLNQTLAISNRSYSGERDLCNLRCGKGVQHWIQKWQQTYNGNFLNDCLHGTGTYTWNLNDGKFVYEGRFYVNNFDGYGILSYPDGKIHEGLFKNNNRFGPGVLTYSDGTQDIGLWYGLSLIRLSRNKISQNVPVLGGTVHGKTYLLQYKTLISINIKYKLGVEDILTKLEIPEEVVEKNRLFYSNYVRNPKSIFFDHKLFYNNYFHDESDYTVDIVENLDELPVTKKIVVSDLVAWNNEEIFMSIMRHCFVNRNFEKILSYHIEDILNGRSEKFREIGSHESFCLEFLETCCTDNDNCLIKLICEYDIHPDLSDNTGNSGITFAASYDNVNIIKTLVNFGANIDHLNDECLTPLLICILRYIALKYNVTNWEKAFLPPINTRIPDANVQEWRRKDNENIEDLITDTETQKYLFDLSCVHPVKMFQKVKPEKSKKKDKKNVKEDMKRSINNETSLLNDPNESGLQNILNTILVLLTCGADVNFGEVPFSPLILTLFAKNLELLLNLINSGADCNIVMHTSDILTPLHIICSMYPANELIKMTEILLEGGANPNSRAGQSHWSEEKDIILANVDTEDFGKTPLHLVSMRWDFENDTDDIFGNIFTVFLKFNADLNLLYLGHTPLSLAIIRGNIRLVNRMLDSSMINPNQHLGNNMGLPLNVLTLKRYANILPINISRSIFDILFIYNANPFNSVPKFDGNAIEFTIQENLPADAKSKAKKTKTKSDHSKVIQYLNICAGKTLLRHIQGKVVEALYIYKIEHHLQDEIYDCIVNYIDVFDTLNVLQVLINYKRIRPTKEFCYDLLEYVYERTSYQNPKKQNISLPDLVEKLDFKQKAKICFFGNYPPEVDSEQKYRVCFECYQKTNKVLILCPKCKLVYFCSDTCNNLSIKKKTKHQCNISFYSSEVVRINELAARAQKSQKSDLFKTFKKGMTESTEDLSKYGDAKSSGKISRKGTSKKRRTSSRDSQSSSDVYEDKSKRKKRKDTSKEKDKTVSGKDKHKTKRDESKRKDKKGKRQDSSEDDESLSDVKGKSRSKASKKSKDKSDSERNLKQKLKSKKDTKDSSREKVKGKLVPEKHPKDKSAAQKAHKNDSESRKAHKDDSEIRKARKDKSSDRKYDRDKSTPRKDKSKTRKRSTDSARKDYSDKSKARKDVRHENEEVSFETKRKSRKRAQSVEKGDRTKYESKLQIKRDESKLRLRDKVATDDYMNFVTDDLETNDILKFNEMFMPYCILIDGQLYYKFEGQNVFYKMTYSNV